MASDGLISRLQLSLMPTLAILTHELNGLVSSWLVRLWLVAAAVGTFFVVALLLSWAIAEVSFRTYESRFLALKDRLAGRWSRAQTASSPRGGDDGARTPGRASVHPSAVDA